MSAKRYVKRSPAVAARILGGEMVIMSAHDSTVFTLNEVATVLWEAADGATPLEDIVASEICERFEVAPEVALHDAEELVQELTTHGILLLSDQPFEPGQETA